MHGFRSGLEESIAQDLDDYGTRYAFERLVLEYKVEEVKKYTPDFLLPNGIIVESKGRFTTADRKKMKLVKKQHPDLDIRMVFNNPNAKISKLSKTTYGMWCEREGYPYAKQSIPVEWLSEPVNEASCAAVIALLGHKPDWLL